MLGRSPGVQKPQAVPSLTPSSLATTISCHAFQIPTGSRILTITQSLTNRLSSGTRTFSYDWTAILDLIGSYYEPKPRPSLPCTWILDIWHPVLQPSPLCHADSPKSYPSSLSQHMAMIFPSIWLWCQHNQWPNQCLHWPIDFLDVQNEATCLIPRPLVMSIFPSCFCFSKVEWLLMGQRELFWPSCLPLKTCSFPLALTKDFIDPIFSLEGARGLPRSLTAYGCQIWQVKCRIPIYIWISDE